MHVAVPRWQISATAAPVKHRDVQRRAAAGARRPSPPERNHCGNSRSQRRFRAEAATKRTHARDYDGRVSLSLLAGPANAGKVALLLERYLERLDDEPFLIVPTRSDIDRVERDLLRRSGCLFGGEIGTFDTLFERIAKGDPAR